MEYFLPIILYSAEQMAISINLATMATLCQEAKHVCPIYHSSDDRPIKT